MKLNLYVLFISVTVFISGCGTPVDKSKLKEAGLESIHALCNIQNGNLTVVCVDYGSDSQQNEQACAMEEKTHYEKLKGATFSSYTGVGNSPSTTTGCELHNRGLTVLGTCLLDGRGIRYYATAWVAASAKDDCNIRNGNWLAPEN